MNVDGRALVVLVCLVCVFAAGTSVTAASTHTADDEPRLTVTDTTVDEGESSRVRVRLSEVPDGLAGFSVTLSLESSGVAELTGASYPDTYALTTKPEVGPDGQTITFEAVDLEDTVTPGTSAVTLATVNVSGVATGSTELTVSEATLDADGGGRIDPAFDAGTVTVENAVSPTESPTNTERSTTPSGSPTMSPGTDTPMTTDRSDDASDTLSANAPGFTGAVAFVALAVLVLFARHE